MINDMETAVLEAENLQLKQENERLTGQVKWLTEQLFLMRQNKFGHSSEKTTLLFDDAQMTLFNEAELESDDDASELGLEQITYQRKKQKGKRETDLSGFPVEQILCEVPEDKKACPKCGEPLHVCAHDIVRRELVRIPAQYKVTEYVSEVCACRACDKNSTQTPIVKGKVPAPVIPGSGIASPSLIAHIAHQKYTLALPLYRQEQEFKRDNISLSRQTMTNWLIYVTFAYLQFIYDAMKCELLTRQVLHADETSVQVLNEQGKAATSKSYMWLYRTSGDTNRHIVLFDYQPDRKYEKPRIFLEGFHGYLHTDGYQAYHKLPPDIMVIGCWAHMRRKFTDVLKALPDYNRPHSAAVLGKEYCDRLFALEQEYSKLPTDDHFKGRYEARLKSSKPVMDEFLHG